MLRDVDHLLEVEASGSDQRDRAERPTADPQTSMLCLVNLYGTLHFPMLRGFERVLKQYMYVREVT